MRRWWPLVALVACTFVLVLDVNIVNVALPDISRSLHASFSELQWVADIYSLVVAAVLLGAGSVADRYGHRRLFLVGCGLFGLGSLSCALAPTAELLIAARAAHGLGSAAMLATGAALISLTYTGRDRGVAFGVWAAVASLGSALGPIFGGLITQYWGWRWIFGVNLPVVLAAIVIAAVSLAPTPGRGGIRFDWLGITTFSLSVGGLVYGLIHSGEVGWGSPSGWAPVMGGAILVALFVVIESRTRHPILDLQLFRRPPFVAMIVAATVTNAAGFAMFPYLSVWLQSILSESPVRAGLMLLPLAGACLVTSLGMSPLTHRIAPRWLVSAGLLLIAIGSFLVAELRPDSSGWALAPGLTVAGAGVGLVLPSLTAAVMASVTPDRVGMASGALNTFRNLGYAVGVAVFGAVFTAEAGSQLSPPGVVLGLSRGYLLATALAAVALVVVLLATRTSRTPRAASAPPAASHQLTADNENGVTPVLSGRVTTPDGAVIQHAIITMIDGQGLEIGIARTDPEGTYRFGTIPSGNYTIVAGAPRHQPNATVVSLHHAGHHVDLVLVPHHVEHAGSVGAVRVPKAEPMA